MGEHLSPVVLRQLTHLAIKLGSFAAASDSLEETLEIDVNTKRVERQTDRIGSEPNALPNANRRSPLGTSCR